MKSKLGFPPTAIAVSARCQMIVSVLNCNQLHHTSHSLPSTLFFINYIIHCVHFFLIIINYIIHRIHFLLHCFSSTTSYIVFIFVVDHNQLHHTLHSINYIIYSFQYFVITINFIIHRVHFLQHSFSFHFNQLHHGVNFSLLIFLVPQSTSSYLHSAFLPYCFYSIYQLHCVLSV